MIENQQAPADAPIPDTAATDNAPEEKARPLSPRLQAVENRLRTDPKLQIKGILLGYNGVGVEEEANTRGHHTLHCAIEQLSEEERNQLTTTRFANQPKFENALQDMIDEIMADEWELILSKIDAGKPAGEEHIASLTRYNCAKRYAPKIVECIREVLAA